MILTLSPYVFTAVQTQEGSPKPVAGLGIIPFGIFAVGMIISAVLILIGRSRESTGVERQQNIFVLLSIALMFGAIIFTVFIPAAISGTNTFVSFIPLYALTFLGMTAYAIIKHQLFNIKVLAAQVLAFALAIITLFEALFSNNPSIFIFRISIFFLALSFGVLLIRSVRKEVEQREQLETLTKKLELANEELKRLDKAKSEFVSIASHQLRTPLTASKGYISLVLEGTYGALEEKFKKPLQKVYYSNERLIHLVNDLLSLSRIESGKMKLDQEPTDVSEIVKSVIEELQIKAEENGLKLIFKKPAPALAKVLMDKEKIRNVVLNLIDNAIRYTKQGSITVKLKIQNSKLKIEVTDTGEGMTKEEIAKLFESFSRGRAGEKLSTEGAGLGLYIARQFVEMHKGKIWAESEGKGKGSIFHVELPIK